MAEGSGQEEVELGRVLEEAKRHVAPCAEACAQRCWAAAVMLGTGVWVGFN